MELRQIRYFLAIAEEGHFTRAATRLYVSQPNLSQQIRQLENELKTILFDRTGRQVRLTAAGELFAQHARRVIQELDDAQLAINELTGLQRGALSLGVVQTVNNYLLPDVVAGFAARYPGILVCVKEASAGEIERGVVERTLQLGIGFMPTKGAEVEFEHLFTEELMLIVPLGHPLSGRSHLAVSELDNVTMVLLGPDFCTRRLWEESARSAGIRLRVSLEMNTIGSILAAVRQTGSVTVLPAQTLRSERSDGLIAVPLRDPTPQRTVGMLYRRGGYRCNVTKAFIALLQEVLGQNGLTTVPK